MHALLAINWEPELRGILIVIIAVSVLCGSIYLILGTNMGARLGFLVAFAALAGWMFVMGAIWWSYGKGLLGSEPSWQPVKGQTIIREAVLMDDVGLIQPGFEPSGDATADAATVQQMLVNNDWLKLDSALPAYQQAGSAATVLMEESGVFAAGEFTVVAVYDKGGARHPSFFGDKLDFLAFWHDAHFSVVEVAPLVPQRTEPGRAPARPVIDTSRPHEYVYMVRDLGNKRVPAGVITVLSLIIFLILCWLLHRRDRVVAENRAALPAKA